MAGERSLGSLVYWFRVRNDELKQKAAESSQAIRDMAGEFDKSKRAIKSWSDQARESLRQVSDFVQRNKETIQAVAVGAGAALAGLTLEIKKATQEHIKFTNALTGLRSVAAGTGQDLNKTTEAARILAADGLMSVGEAATGLKNLLLAGFGLEEAIVLMERFKDSAAFGRQGALSFGQAIVSATEGVKNGNSILVDNAGVTKNLSVMLQEAGYSAQDLMRAADDAGVRMAIFNGIIRETRHQVGDAAKLVEGLGGALSRTEESMRKVHRAIGAAVEGPLRQLLNTIQPILENIAGWIEQNKSLVGGLITLATALAGLTASGTAWLLLIPKIGAALRLFTSGPVGWTILGLTTLVTLAVAVKNAMQDAREAQGRLADSYQRQADEVDALIEEYQELSKKTSLTADEKQRMIDLSNQIVEILPQAAKGYDEEGNAILDLNAALREMVLLKGKELEIRSQELGQRIREEEERLRKAEKRRADLEAEWSRRQQRWETWGQYPEQEILNELAEEYNREWRKTTEEINAANQAITNFKQQQKDIQDILSGITPEWMRKQRKARPQQTGGEEITAPPVDTFDTAEFFDKLQKELDTIDKVAEAFGDTSDVAKDKANALRRAIVTLAEEGIDPTNTTLGNLVELYKKYSDEVERAETATKNAKEATNLLAQAQEYLYRMTGKQAPEWERFAQKLEEMAGEEGVLPEVAAQLREIAALIRQEGEAASATNAFVDMFVAMGDKIEEARNKYERFRSDFIDGITDAIMKGEGLLGVLQQIANELARMFLRKGVEYFASFLFPPLPAAHAGALVTPYGLVQDLPEYHNGGIVGLRSDERVIKVLTGERVLSRAQNAAFEAGLLRPDIDIEIINNTGVPIEERRETEFDGPRTVVRLFLEGYGRNIDGIQRILQPR